MSDHGDRALHSEDIPWSSGGANRGIRSIPSVLAELRKQMETLYALRDITLPSLGMAQSGQPFTVALPADPDGPLDRFSIQQGGVVVAEPQDAAEATPGVLGRDAAAEQARGAVAAGIHLPYWGLLWASGQALAETVLAERQLIRGRRVLEIGCGLGLTAAAALAAGASLLWAVDCFAEALLFSTFNGLQVAGRIPQTRLLDWRTSLGQEACRALGLFDIVLAADVLYEEDDVEPLLELVPTLLLPDGAFWLAEPGRRVSRKFVKAARDRSWRDSESSILRAWPPDGEVVQVSVHRLKPHHS